MSTYGKLYNTVPVQTEITHISSSAVSGDGQTLVECESSYDDYRGRLRIYRRIDGVWVYKNSIVANDGTDFDYLGYQRSIDVSYDGNYIVVGAYGWEGVFSDQGAAYVFQKTGDTTWVQRGSILYVTPTSRIYFGRFVSINDDGTVVVVAYTSVQAGQAVGYIYDWNGSSWIVRGEIPIGAGVTFDPVGQTNTTSNMGYGNWVSISGNGLVLAIGAPFWDAAPSTTNIGAVYIFDWISNAWVERSEHPLPIGSGGTKFGSQVFLNDLGDKICIVHSLGVLRYDWNGSSWIGQEAFSLSSMQGICGISNDMVNIYVNAQINAIYNVYTFRPAQKVAGFVKMAGAPFSCNIVVTYPDENDSDGKGVLGETVSSAVDGSFTVTGFAVEAGISVIVMFFSSVNSKLNNIIRRVLPVSI